MAPPPCATSAASARSCVITRDVVFGCRERTHDRDFRGAVRPLLPMIIRAGVDLQQILRLDTPQEVRDEVKRLIDILGQNGGYILGPGHTYIQVDAPIENILTMYDTAAAYTP